MLKKNNNNHNNNNNKSLKRLNYTFKKQWIKYFIIKY